MAVKDIIPKDLWYRHRLREVCERILADKAKNKPYKPYILGVDGIGCSGKTVLSDKLNETLQGYNLRIQVLHIDDFIVQKAERDDTSKRTLAENYYEIQFRYDYLKDTILTPMRKGKGGFVEAEFYDLSTDSYNVNQVNLFPDITILEGVFLHRPELDGFMDLSVYMSIDRETQLARAISRYQKEPNRVASIEKYEKKYNPAEERYIRECDPAKKADILFDNKTKSIVYNNQSLAHGVQKTPIIRGK